MSRIFPFLAVGAGILLVSSRGSGSSSSGGTRKKPSRCIYQTYNWSTALGKTVNHSTVDKPYSEVAGDEIDPNDPRCTVCEGDQVTIKPAAMGLALDPFRVCWAHEDGMIRALERIKDTGKFDLRTVTTYRPGRTRGAIVDGMRTEMSNHSYGTAIDINRAQNGLYRNCPGKLVDASSVANCTLAHGGAWNPKTRPLTSITADGDVARILQEELGWKWGGGLPGSTKDIMHFSKTGK
jgi:hypothetical protein